MMHHLLMWVEMTVIYLCFHPLHPRVTWTGEDSDEWNICLSLHTAKIAGIDFTFTTPTVILLQIFFYVMVTLLFGYKYENNL